MCDDVYVVVKTIVDNVLNIHLSKEILSSFLFFPWVDIDISSQGCSYSTQADEHKRSHLNEKELVEYATLFYISPSLKNIPKDMQPKFVQDVVKEYLHALISQGKHGDFGWGCVEITMLVVIMQKNWSVPLSHSVTMFW